MAEEGDRDSFRTLYNLSKDSVFRFALSIVKNYHTAEDILSETMLRIASNANKYQFGSNPKAWILGITRNLCLDVLKKSSLKDISIDDITENLAFNDDSFFASESENEAINDLKILTLQQQEIISLYVFAELKQTEIASILKIPYTRVRSQYKYALKKLRDYYKRKGDLQ
jgi:RNA polymerase sigma-70 factor (ECF subfamily)